LRDAVGNLTSGRDPLLRDTAHTYDALGRLRTTLRNVGGIGAQTQVQYDALDRIVQVTDPGGLNTAYTYNGFGDLLGLSSPDTGATSSTYDSAGNLATRTDARNLTATYGHDALDRVTSVTYPDTTRNLGFVYDAAPAACPTGERFHVGRVARMTDASGETAFCYDRFGNLTRKVQTTQGRPFTVRYDHAPRVRTGGDAPMRPRAPVAAVYGITYPDGAQVRIGRNGRGQATDLTVTLAGGQVKTLVQGTTHYPYGPAWWWTYGNGRKLTHSRNAAGRPGFVEDARAGGLNEGYWFDAAGNLTSLRNASQADPPKRTYGYDGLDRLTEVRDGASSALLQGYTYNATGDRTTDTAGTTRSYVYAAGSHKLSSVGGVNRAYDAAGNTIRIGGAAAAGAPSTASSPAIAAGERPQARSWRAQFQARAQAARAGKRVGKRDAGTLRTFVEREPPVRDWRNGRRPRTAASTGAAQTFAPANVREFAYDDAGRMKQVKRDGVVAMNYLYNARGERVYRNGSSQTVHTVYDEGGHWLGDYAAAGNALQQAIWLDDLPVGLLVGAGANQTLYYLEPDALGSPRVAIDPDRDVAVWRWDLTGEAFGNSAPNEDPDADGIAFVLDMRFPGQRYDAATELNYNYFRDYDPNTGRYVQRDPIGLAGGVNTYGYVSQNPIRGYDPLGLDDASECDCLAGIGKPAGQRFKLDRPNMDWRHLIHVSTIDGLVVVSGRLTVSGPYAQFVANDVNSFWSSASGEHEGIKYRVEISMTPVRADGDWKIRRMLRRKWDDLNSELCNGHVGAKVDEIGGSLLEIPPIDFWRENGTAAHEFGHALGLSHATQGSGSIMSYDIDRKIIGQDIYNLAGGYR